MYGRSEVVIKSIDIGYFRLRVTNHIYIICTGCTPKDPFTPIAGCFITIYGNLLRFVVITHCILSCIGKGFGQINLGNLGLVDSFFSDRNDSLGQSDRGDVCIAEGIVGNTCYIVCLTIVGDLCRNHNIS